MAARRSIDDALMGIKAQAELSTVRNEVSRAEQQACQPRVNLPLSSRNLQPVPNSMIRTELFSTLADQAKRNGCRGRVKDMQLAGLSNMSIIYTGELLDQQDLDVYLAVLHEASSQPMGNEIALTARQLMVVQRKGDGGRVYANLHTSIARLASATVTIDQGGIRFTGSLIASAKRQCVGEEWRVRLDQNLVNLFAPGGFSSINLLIRSELHGKPLAKWLDAYFCSQPHGHALKVETVMKLCGSSCAATRSFRQTLAKAMDHVATARLKHGMDFSWKIDASGLLRVRCG